MQAEVLILCGGFGTRLQTVVGDRPKSLAPVHGQPFLLTLIQQIQLYGFQRVIFCAGYMASQIRAFSDQLACRYPDTEWLFSPEPEPLGTAGALRFAEPLMRTELALVMNGDSICQANLAELVTQHVVAQADFTVTVTESELDGSQGAVTLNRDLGIQQFSEKNPAITQGYVNAGVYAINRSLLQALPFCQPLSLEHTVIPGWLKAKKRGRAFVVNQPVYDIGTPERLLHYQQKY